MSAGGIMTESPDEKMEKEIRRLLNRIIESDGHPIEAEACLRAAMSWAREHPEALGKLDTEAKS